MKLSIIVPVYNVEKFLPRCLDSLLRQGIERGMYEVICVNDGSPDSSAQILIDYESKFPDVFKVITQDNQGVSVARNRGLAIAQGEWIAFVDPDDYVIDGAFNYLLDQFCHEGIDVIHFNCTFVYTDGVILHDPDAKPNGYVTMEGDGAEIYNKVALTYTWSKIFRRTILERYSIRFEQTLMEDELFNFTVFSHHPHLRVITSNLYRYEQGNINSQLTVIDKEKVKSQLREMFTYARHMSCHMRQGDELESAARRNYDGWLRGYVNKMLKARFNRSEWCEYTNMLQNMPVKMIDTSREITNFGRIINHLKNLSTTSYLIYCIMGFILRGVFTSLVRPRIIASYSSKK